MRSRFDITIWFRREVSCVLEGVHFLGVTPFFGSHDVTRPTREQQ